jgi:integrase
LSSQEAPLPGGPLGLNAEKAADYIGINRTYFFELMDSDRDLKAASFTLGRGRRGRAGRRIWPKTALDWWLERKRQRPPDWSIGPALSPLLFPSASGKPLSDMTFTKLLRDRGLADRAKAHGFRSSFRDWPTETNQCREVVAEAALAHTIKDKTEAAGRLTLRNGRG